MKKSASLLVTIFLTVLAPVWGAVSCSLSDPITLDNNGYLELQQFVNDYEGTFTMKLTYYGQAYIAIGVNENGRARMVPATAIIGRADGGTPTVDKYTISNYNGVDMTTNTGLYNASFVQTTDSSILTFTQALDQFAQVSIASDTQWIYAVGRDGNSFGRHAMEGSFQLPLTSTCTVVTAAPTEPPTAAPVVVTETTATPVATGTTQTQVPVSTGTTQTEVPVSTGTTEPQAPVEGTTSETETENETEGEDDGDEAEAEAPTSASGSNTQAQGTSTGSAAASAACSFADAIALDQNGLLELQQFTNPDLGTYTMKLTYSGGRAFIGIGINQNGVPQMTPAIAVIGRADGGSPSVQRYQLSGGSSVQLLDSSLQTLVNASFVQTDSESTLTFTHYLSESGQTAISDSTQWIYAVGFSDNRWNGHSLQGGFKLSLTPSCQSTGTGTGTGASATQGGIVFASVGGEPDKKMWRTHGILMALAWGLCAPLAIGASVLRTAFARLGISKDKGLWFKIHLYMNVGTSLLTFAGFVVALAATKQQGDEHFEGTHPKMGLAIFTLVLVQGIAGFLRPGLPKPKSSSSSMGDEESDDEPTKIKKDTLDKTERDPSAPMRASIDSNGASESSKSTVRIAWEWGHRFLGLALLAMAWYNCDTGIELAAEFWEDASFDKTAAFWGVVGGLASVIVVARVILQLTE